MVVTAIAAVVYVVLNGPDQPATIRRQPPRAKPPRRRRSTKRGAGPEVGGIEEPIQEVTVASAPAPRSPVTISPSPAFALPDSDVMRLRVLPANRTTLWVRIRSGVALVVLVAILGALLALTVGGLVLGAALLIRSATG